MSCSFFIIVFYFNIVLILLYFQMAFELYGMLAGSVSPMTGENVKPAYGGEEEAFLRKVITPIYNTIAEVVPLLVSFCLRKFLLRCFDFLFLH